MSSIVSREDVKEPLIPAVGYLEHVLWNCVLSLHEHTAQGDGRAEAGSVTGIPLEMLSS